MLINSLQINECAAETKDKRFSEIADLVKKGKEVPKELQEDYLKQVKEVYFVTKDKTPSAIAEWAEKQRLEDMKIMGNLFLTAASKEIVYAAPSMTQLRYEMFLIGCYLKESNSEVSK